MKVAELVRHPSALIVANAGTQAGIRFVSNIVLTHLLAPAAFALVGVTMLLMVGVAMVSDIGIAMMTLRHGPMNDADQAKMWTMQFTRGVFLAVVLFVLAGPMARLYDAPELATVLRVLAIFPIIQESQSLYPVLQLAKRNLVPNFTIEVGSRIFGTIVAIVVALYSPTVWALVASMLAQITLAVLIGHTMAGKGLPRFDLDLAFMRSHWTFSKWLQLGSTFTFVAVQLDKALFPFLFGLHRFGVYGIGATFALIPAQVTTQWTVNVFYPLVVNALPQGGEAVHRLKRLRTTMLLYASTAALAVMAASPAFFYLLYRPAYHEAARFAALLTANFYFEVAESSLRYFPLVAKSPRYEFVAVVVRVACFLAMAGVIWLAKLDADAYALAFSLAQACSYAFMLAVCRRDGYVSTRPDLMISGVVLAGLLSAYAFRYLPGSIWAAIAELAAIALAGLAAYALIYARRGLPSLPREPAPEQIEAIAEQRELGPVAP